MPSAGDASCPPIYGYMHRISFCGFDVSGDLIEQTTGADSEISKDGGTFADCTNEVVSVKEVGGATDSGFSYLDLTAAEMSASIVQVQVKSTNAKTTPIVLYPESLPIFSTGTCRTTDSPTSSQVQLATGEDSWTNGLVGCYVGLTGNTGVGQIRKITAYNGTTKIATLSAAWGTVPDATTTYALYAASTIMVMAARGASINGGARLEGKVSVITASTIKNASFDADVGSTAYATNIIALAVRKVLDEIALAAELAKVPKSDGAVTWNNTALASINAEVDAALNTAIPGSPTADSINERVATMDAGVTLANGAHGGAAATIEAQWVWIHENGTDPAVTISNDGSGDGLKCSSLSGKGVNIYGAICGLDIAAVSGPGIEIDGTYAIWARGNSNDCVYLATLGTNKDGVAIVGTGSGKDISLEGTATIGGGITGNVGGNVTGTVGGVAGTIQTLDAIWAKIQKWLRFVFRKDAAIVTDHATELAEINVNTGTGVGAFANTTDSVEAIRDRGDAAWVTAAGFSTHSAADVVTALGTGSTLTALATAANLTTLDTLADKIAVLCVGNVTGAGTGTEVFTYATVTATVTVDNSGNRTLVFS